MKIKLDENLPDRLVSVLTGLGHDVDTVRAEQLTGRADPDVWNAAQASSRFLITQDLDFSDMRRYTPGTHAGLRLVRLTRPGRNALLERVSGVFHTENVEDWNGCLVVATEQKVRVRRPTRLPDRPAITTDSDDHEFIGCSSCVISSHDRERMPHFDGRSAGLNARRIPSSIESSSLARSSARKGNTR